MKLKLINFLFIYILVPVLMVVLAIKSGDWFNLFWLGFYAIGVVISKFELWIFLPIPIIFVFWYWYTYGLSFSDYISSFFICLMAGVVLCEGGKLYYRFVRKVLPEQLNNIEYNEKVEEFNRRLEQYRKQHPNEKLTHELVEKIRTEVFF